MTPSVKRKAEHLHGQLDHAATFLAGLGLGKVGHVVRMASDLAGTEAFPAQDHREPKARTFDDTWSETDPKDGHRLSIEEINDREESTKWDAVSSAAASLRGESARAAKRAVRLEKNLHALVALVNQINGDLLDSTGHIPADQLRPWCRTCKKDVATDAKERMIDGRCEACYKRASRA